MEIVDGMTDEKNAVFQRLVSISGFQERLVKKEGEKQPVLTVKITSFSYRSSIPADNSGNGGGFVFDCRALPNPGRSDQYKEKTGLDPDVSGYLESFPEVHSFFAQAYRLVELSIENYLQRGFQHLMVSFGCTGGRHRSVYLANRMYNQLLKDQRISVEVQHTEQQAI